MWKQLGLCAGIVACALMVPSVVSAQEIGGTVTDNTGGVLPGVTVEARSPVLIEQVRSVVTDAAGQYLLISLEPGLYSVTYSLPGFSTVVREEIQINTGFTANIDTQMQVGAVTETITVTGASPIVDVQNVSGQSIMTRDVIDAVPTGRSYQNLGILVPGMLASGVVGSTISQDVGGTAGQNYLTLGIHGGEGNDQAIQVDGMSVATLIREDSTILASSDGNFQEYALDYSANSAEVETGGVRVNMIPRDGGNSFSGGIFTSFSHDSFQSDNVDQDLIDRGLTEPNRVKELWQINPTLGGPIAQDRLWFYLSHTRYRTDQFVAGAFESQDSSALVYVPDTTKQAVDDQVARDTALRLTSQVTPRNKVSLYVNNSFTGRDHLFVGNALGINITPDAALASSIDDNVYQVSWTSPVTNRVLFEFGASKLTDRWLRNSSPEADTSLPGIIEVASGTASRNMSSALGGGGTSGRQGGPHWAYKGSMSYVTGSHSVKVGFTLNHGTNHNLNESTANNQRFITLFGSPLFVDYWGNPSPTTNELLPNLGIYVQDRWTIDRLTVNAGVRFDYYRSGYPDHLIPATQYVPVVRDFPGQTVVTWKDLEPRLGLAYDLFGSGKTAFKVSASRYGNPEGVGFASAINPAGNNNTVRRFWADLNGDGVPQGDPANPLPNGELVLPSPNPAFGQAVVTEFYDPEWAFGWGKRFANWEFSTGVQHELLPSVSLNVAYFRRVFVNFQAVDDRSIGPEDFDRFSVTAPTDSRLPGGGGYVLEGLFDRKPSTVGRLQDEITTSADNFGTRQRHWNGVDVSVNARLNKLMVQGGLSTGRTTQDDCELGVDAPNELFCHETTPFLTQVKLLGSYTLPYDIQIAATFQNVPGPEREASVVFTSAQVAESLGRPLSTSGTVTVNVLEPGTSYGERMNQLDLRATKILNFSGTQVNAMFDLYNVLNGNAVLEENNTFNANWLNPVAILPGRILKFAFQFSF